MSKTKTKWRNVATADPGLIVQYVDSDWTHAQWEVICDAMRRHVPNLRDVNVIPKGPRPQPKPARWKPKPKPSAAELLASRQMQLQLREGAQR